jgi:carboxylesterase type B
VTAFADPLKRIRTGQVAQVPILIGSTEDDGTIFAYKTTQSLSEFLKDQLGPYAVLVPPNLVRSLYPGLNDLHVIYAVIRDVVFRWCVHSTSLI